MTDVTTVEGPLAFDFRSVRSGNVYRMAVEAGNSVRCGCPAGRRGMACYHQREAADWLRAEGIVVVFAPAVMDSIFARFERIAS